MREQHQNSLADRSAKDLVFTAAVAEQRYASRYGSYTTIAADLRPFGFMQPAGPGHPLVNFHPGNATDFCVAATSRSSAVFSQREDQGQPVTGGCP